MSWRPAGLGATGGPEAVGHPAMDRIADRWQALIPRKHSVDQPSLDERLCVRNVRRAAKQRWFREPRRRSLARSGKIGKIKCEIG
jgi:hypothetical protein